MIIFEGKPGTIFDCNSNQSLSKQQDYSSCFYYAVRPSYNKVWPLLRVDHGRIFGGQDRLFNPNK